MFILMHWNGFLLQRNKFHFMLVLPSAEFGTAFQLRIKNLQLRFIKTISKKGLISRLNTLSWAYSSLTQPIQAERLYKAIKVQERTEGLLKCR